MEFNGKDYILGVWFGEKKDTYNFLVTVKKDEEGYWYIETRLRIYNDSKVWNSKDKKYFKTYKTETPYIKDEETIKTQAVTIFDTARAMFGLSFTDYVEVKGDMYKMSFLMATRPWSNFKTVPKG